MESHLQIADHWVTIIGGFFTVALTVIAIFLTYKTYVLSKHDREKTLALNEMKEQTKQLRQLFIYQIQPRFYAEAHINIMKIINIGGDCFNLKITLENNNGEKNPLEKMGSYFSSHAETRIFHREHSTKNFVFMFEDQLGNKMKQTLYVSQHRFSNVEYI